MTRIGLIQGIGGLCGIILLVFPPEDPHLRMVVIDILIFSFLAISFDIVFGYTGLLSLAQALYFGTAAYLLGYGLVYWELPMMWAALLALAAAGLCALITGYIAVRISGHGFLIVTLIFVSVAFAWAQANRYYTGGDDGIVLPAAFFSFLGGSIVINNAYYIVLILFLLTYGAAIVLIRSPLGLLMRAAKCNERRIEFLGLNARSIKLVAFVFSGLVAGVGGLAYTLTFKHVSSDLLHWSLSAEALIWAFFGGLGTIVGPVLGAAVLITLEDAMIDLVGYPKLFSGALLIIMVLLHRGGLAGLLVSGLTRLSGRYRLGIRKGRGREQSAS